MKKLWFVLLFISMATPLMATTRYVKPTAPGNDSNSCAASTSSATPKQHVNGASGAIACMAAGDTLIVMDGTYNEQILNTIPGGSAGNPTIIIAANNHGAIFLPTAPTASWAVININHSYITIDGLVTDATNASDNGGIWITGDNSTTNVIIQHCDIKNNIGSHSSPSAMPSGILMNEGTTNHQFIDNDIHNTRQNGIYLKSSGNIVRNNRIYGWVAQSEITSYGIQMYCVTIGCAPSNNTIYGNSIHDYQNGITLGPNGGFGSNNTFYNNVIYNTQTIALAVRYKCTDCTVYNNTVYNNGSYCMFIDGEAVRAVVRNNICYQNSDGAILNNSGSSVCTNNFNVTGCGAVQGNINPFVSATTYDFHLSSNLNGGFDLTGVGITTDFTGATRSVPPDVGAYEYLALSVRYIATTGSDANSCDASKNSATPKQNFTGTAGAIACMGSGDILVVANGTYAEALLDIVPAGVTIRATTANGPILRPASGTNVVNLTHEGIILDGLDIDGVNVSGSALTGSLAGGNAVNSATVKNGTIRNGGSTCVTTFVGSTFQNNDVFSCGFAGISVISNNTVDGNRIHGTGDAGVVAFLSFGGSDSNIIRNNIIYSNAGSGLVIAGSANTTYNNIVYSNGGGITLFGNGSANRSYNNTFYGNAGWCVDVDTGVQTTQIVNNICLSNEQGAILDQGSNTTCTNNMNVTGCQAAQATANPFVSAGTANFRLTAEDNQGVFLPAVVVDIDNVARGTPSDRGAYEFVGIGVTAGTSIFDVRGMR